jgi:hypothetical protein
MRAAARPDHPTSQNHTANAAPKRKATKAKRTIGPPESPRSLLHPRRHGPRVGQPQGSPESLVSQWNHQSHFIPANIHPRKTDQDEITVAEVMGR